MHIVIVQPARLHGVEILSVTSSHVKRLGVTEMNMCRRARSHTRNDHVRKINTKIHGDHIAERIRKVRPMWLPREKRREQYYVGRQALLIAPHGRRRRVYCVNGDMGAIGGDGR